MESRDVFDSAAAMYRDLVARVPADRLADPGLGEWTVRDLIGHTLRAVLTVETYLAAPDISDDPVVDLPSAAAYFRAGREYGSPTLVAERGREAGVALGDDVSAAVDSAITRATATVRAAAATEDPVVATPMGTIRLSTYLTTRTFELVVHSCDIAAAVDLTIDVPEAAMMSTLDLLSRMAVLDGRGPELALALTGRSQPGFTLL